MAVASYVPIALFPLKIETRFVGQELWIRVFPDKVFMRSHEPQLNAEEIKDAQQFKNTTEADQKVLWEELVAKYGVYRASWIVQIEAEQLAEFENKPDDNKAASFYFNSLPDRFYFYLYQKVAPENGNEKKIGTYEGKTIEYEQLAILDDEEDNTRKDWLNNFDIAIDAGLGIRIPLKNNETSFERIIVSGIRSLNPRDTTNTSGKELQSLLQNHQYTEGLSFLAYGTPTNNSEEHKSGYSSKEEYEIKDSFDYAVHGLTLAPNSVGEKLANLLSFPPDALKNIQHADVIKNPLNEIFQKASWFALGAQPLFMLFDNQISSETHLELWNHYADFVRAKGNYSSLKISNQPYGVLPVSNIRSVNYHEENGEKESNNKKGLYGKMEKLFPAFLEEWVKMTDLPSDTTNNPNYFQISVPRLSPTTNTQEVLLSVLSMQAQSSTFQIRALEYDNYQKSLAKRIRHLSNEVVIHDSSDISFIDYPINNQLKNRIVNLLKLTEATNEQPSNLLKAPILNFQDSGLNVLGFRDGKLSRPDNEGAELLQPENIFSLTEDSFDSFKTFIEALETSAEDKLIQYKGALSLFTNLFIKSYQNAAQLYNRNIVFNPTIEELRWYPKVDRGIQSYLQLTISQIIKKEGDEVSTKDEILIVKAERNIFGKIYATSIPIHPPFQGKIEKINVAVGDKIDPGISLFFLKNESQYNAIKKEFIQLGKQIIAQNPSKEAQLDAITESIDLNSYRLDAWITAMAARKIDKIRKDSSKKQTISFGAYGWVENLTKRIDNTITPENLVTDYQEKGGIIHAPSSAQAVTAAIFKNSFLSYMDKDNPDYKSNPFALNLTSDRLQKSNFLLEGIRQGQELEALLGYQLERALHENQLDHYIPIIRKYLPLQQNISREKGMNSGFEDLSVINGLKVIKDKNDDYRYLSDSPIADLGKLSPLVQQLEDTLDGSLDALFYESGYQVVQGNLSHAAAALDATKGEIEPPSIESVKTRIPGVGLAHKLVMLLPTAANKYKVDSNCRGLMEPTIENWLKQQLGDLGKIGCVVALINDTDNTIFDTLEVKVADLKIGYLDFLYLSENPVEDGASELEWRIWNYVQTKKTDLPATTKYRITEKPATNCQALSQALEIARYATTLLSQGRYLKSEDLSLESESINYDWSALAHIKESRLDKIMAKLKTLTTDNLGSIASLAMLAKLDFVTAKVAYLKGELGNPLRLKEEIGQKINKVEKILIPFTSQLTAQTAYYETFDLLHDAVKVLFGSNFLLLPPAKKSPKFTKVLKSNQQDLLIGNPANNQGNQVWGQERIENWVQGLAQVKEQTQNFEDWLMVSKVWQQSMELNQSASFKIVQGPTLLQYPWVGLSKAEIDQLLSIYGANTPIYTDPETGESYPNGDDFYPDGSESTVIYTSNNSVANDSSVSGIVIEEFSEHIPNNKIDTAISFHYNAPNSEAPQAILLAVHPDEDNGKSWTEEIMRDILYDTMDLYKVRMVDQDAMKKYGYLLPMVNWLNIPKIK